MLRRWIASILVFVFPIPAFAGENAMVYAKGSVSVNGIAMAAPTGAVLSGDAIQTQADSVATINLSGSSVTLQPQSTVHYLESSVVVNQGGVSVRTSRRESVQVGDLTATPKTDDVTLYEVWNLGGQVKIIAKQGDLNIVCEAESTTLPEGEVMTRNEGEHCKKAAKLKGAYPPGTGTPLSSPWLWGGVGIGGGILCAILCFPTSMSQSSR
jgi:hypothetical protein